MNVLLCHHIDTRLRIFVMSNVSQSAFIKSGIYLELSHMNSLQRVLGSLIFVTSAVQDGASP